MRIFQIRLTIISAFGFMLVPVLFFMASPLLKDVSTGVFLLGIMLLIEMGLVFYWSNTAYKYTRVVKWYNPEHIATRLEHLLEHNSRLWRATTLVFAWLLCIIAYAVLGGFIG
jgi:hypothetical protein